MRKDDKYSDLVLEEIRSQNVAVLESVKQIQDAFQTLATKDEVAEVKADVKAIRAAITYTNKDLIDLDQRVTVLEQAA